MKRILSMAVCFFLLCGCSNSQKEMNTFINLRKELLSCKPCRFDAEVTADYEDSIVKFELKCESQNGNLNFTVSKPETICGINGNISESESNLKFENTVLVFEPFAETEISPVGAPWILIQAIRSGCINSVTSENNLFMVNVDDSYKEDALHLDVYLTPEGIPVQAEIFQENRRIISMKLKNFGI